MIIVFILYILIIILLTIFLQQKKNINDINDIIYNNEFSLFDYNFKIYITKDILIYFFIYILIFTVIIEPIIYLLIYKSKNTITGLHESISLKKLTNKKLSKVNFFILLIKFIFYQIIFSFKPLILYGLVIFILYLYTTKKLLK